MKKLIDHLCDRLDELKRVRSNYEPQWKLVKDLVRPTNPDISVSIPAGSRGSRKHDRIYDGTAPHSNELLAGGLHAYLTSPHDRWFSFSFVDKPSTKLSLSDRQMLEGGSDFLYHYLSRQDIGFNTSAHELYLDLCAFGSAVMYIDWNKMEQKIQFKTYPLTDVWIDENYANRVDTVYRSCPMTTRQLMQMFPKSLTPAIKKEDLSKQYNVIHAVFPRGERDFKALDKKNMPYASVYFIPEEKLILEEGGYKTFPYIVPRWSKLAGEVYASSPAMSCLPDIQMINHMMKEVIISAQLSNRPPIIAVEDSLFPPVSLVPGSLLIKSAGSEFPQPLLSGSSPQITFEMMNHARQHIQSCFFIDFLKNDFKKERQTAYEIADRRDEKLMMLSPILGRLEEEFLSPTIDRMVALFSEHTELAKASPLFDPASKSRFKIFFTSTASRAQLSGKAAQINRVIQEVIPLANVYPEILQRFHPDRLVDEITTLRAVSPNILRTDAELRKLQEAQQQQMQQQQLLEAAPAAAGAIKDVAHAQSLQKQ